MEPRQWTPATLLETSGGYWSACAIHAGVKLDLFTHLVDRDSEAADLANLLSIDPRGLGMLLDALSALGLLEKSDSIYRATDFAAQFLSKSSPAYLGYIIQHHHHLMAGWSMLDKAVTSGEPVKDNASHTDNEIWRESFEMGMFNLAMLLAPKIVKEIDLAGRKRLLDLGGGPGTYAIQFCLQNPALSAVVYDLPTTRQFAEKTIARFGMEQRIQFEDGDFLIEGIKGSYDVAWLSHILHSVGPAGCAVILEKAVAALEPGGTLMIQEFILNDQKNGPPFPALFSLNMLVGTETGRSYSESELMRMMSEAGLIDLKRIAVDLPNGAGILSGKAPNV